MKDGHKAVILNERVKPFGAAYDGVHEYSSGHKVPVFDVYTSTALTQLAGYAKYLNRNYGNVFFRGEHSLYDNLKSSFSRCCMKSFGAEKNRIHTFERLIAGLVKRNNDLDLSQSYEEFGAADLAEAMLQHYGVPTRFVDVVDNLWVALWFGAHRSHSETTDGVVYTTYKPAAGEGAMPVLRGPSSGLMPESRVYQYLLLMAVPGDDNTIRAIDLRRYLPSYYLRPHAQHGVVLKGDDADYSKCVVGILKIDVLRALRWLGDGQLVSYENLFPSPMFDHGYSKLLNDEELSGYDKKIIRYVYSV